MADNLTVRGAGADGSTPAAATEPAAAARAAERDRQLERLRSFVKARTGRIVNDEVLAALLERRAAQRAQQERLAETQTVFASERARESMAASGASGEQRAQKALGTVNARTPDGLPERDRAAVRGDPRAGPRLPPTPAQPPTAAQAKGVVEKMVACLATASGAPFDVQTYAQTIREAPARAPASQEAPVLRRASTAMGTSAPAAASFRLGASPTPGRTASEPARNTGGGLVGGAYFDGRHFNWDAFFVKFLISSVEDLGYWRKMMRELRALANEAALAAHEFELAFVQDRQQFQQLHAMLGFLQQIGSAHETARKDAAHRAGGTNARGAVDNESSMRSFLQKRGANGRSIADVLGLGDRVLLTEDERRRLRAARSDKGSALGELGSVLDGLEAYEASLQALHHETGDLGYLGFLERERALLADTNAGATSVDAQIETLRRDLPATVGIVGSDPHFLPELHRFREQLRRRDEELARDIAGDPQAQPPRPPLAGAAREATMAERAAGLRWLARVDGILAQMLPRSGPFEEKLRAEAALGAGVTPPERLLADAAPEEVRRSHAAARTAALATGHGGVPELPRGHAERDIAALEGSADAGERFTAAHKDAYGLSTTEKMLERLDEGLGAASKRLEGQVTNGALTEAVREAVGRAVQTARESRTRLDRLVEQTTGEAQGMLNQLVAVALGRLG